MALVNLKDIEGVLTPEQQALLIERVPDAMVGVEGEGLWPVTWVTVEEVPSGAWGIGGQSITTSAVQAMAAG